MLILFKVLIQIKHIRLAFRLSVALFALPLLPTGIAVSSEPVSTTAKPDVLRRFDTYSHIELEEDIRIVDYPILSVEEGKMMDFGLSVAYNQKHVEILGITTPVEKARLNYAFSNGKLHFNWKRPDFLTIAKGDTLAILHIYLKHNPNSHLDHYFRISPEEADEWRIALPEVELFYYETEEEEEVPEEEIPMEQPSPYNYNREIALRQQGGKASGVEIMSVIPNPMKTWADVTYSVHQDCMVSLKLYTLLGEEVATLVNDQRSEGLYRHNITPPGFSAGIYVLRLSTVHGNTMESDFMKVVVHNN